MGVKAVVEAVWEPKQEGELDGLTVEMPWSDEDRVSEIAGWCEKELGVVGMIYTDLTPYVRCRSRKSELTVESSGRHH